MYTDDYDEAMVLSAVSPPSGDLSQTFAWQDLVQPYSKNYQICFCPDTPYKGKTFMTTSPQTKYWDYLTSYAISPVIDALNFQFGTHYDAWVTRDHPWINSIVPAGTKWEGITGLVDPAGATTGIPLSQPAQSVRLSAVARQTDYVFIYDSFYYDGGFASVGSQADVFGYCQAWTDFSGNPLETVFYGPIPRHNNVNSNTCDLNLNNASGKRGYDKGLCNICFLDGHVKAMKLTTLLHRTTPDGQYLYYYTISQ